MAPSEWKLNGKMYVIGLVTVSGIAIMALVLSGFLLDEIELEYSDELEAMMCIKTFSFIDTSRAYSSNFLLVSTTSA